MHYIFIKETKEDFFLFVEFIRSKAEVYEYF